MIYELTSKGWINTKAIVAIYKNERLTYFENDKEVYKFTWTILLKTGKKFNSIEYDEGEVPEDVTNIIKILKLKEKTNNE